MNDLSSFSLQVESSIEKELAYYANLVAKMKNEGMSSEQCRKVLSDTVFELCSSAGQLKIHEQAIQAGALISGEMQVSYRELSGKVLLRKSLSSGSTFFFTSEVIVELEVSSNSWVLLVSNNGINQVERSTLVHIGDNSIEDLSRYDDDEILKKLDQLDHSCPIKFNNTSQPLLKEISSRRNLLKNLIANAKTKPELRDSCELLNEFYKYVLHTTSNGIRLRLHVFRFDAEIHAHAHRWSMVSHVLRGPVINSYFGTVDDSNPPIITHRLESGSCYAFDDQLIHLFRGAPGTATLTLRGPAVKESAPEFRRKGLTPKFGAAANKEPSLRMTDSQFEHGKSQLEFINLI